MDWVSDKWPSGATALNHEELGMATDVRRNCPAAETLPIKRAAPNGVPELKKKNISLLKEIYTHKPALKQTHMKSRKPF